MLSRFKPIVTELINPLADVMASIGLKPNHLTVLGLIFGVASAVTISKGNLYVGAIFVFFSSVCDMLDGVIARTQKMVSSFGAFLDSVVDRYVDILIFISLGIYGVDWIAVIVALSGSLMVSYTRARAECVVERCDVGIAERGERLIIIFIGMVTGYIFEAVVIVAVLSHLTALHRILHTRNQLR